KEMANPEGPSFRLLYVTPERLAKSKRMMTQLERCYANRMLKRLVIDEVHCCSQWGHDFRTDYQFLGIMRNQVILEQAFNRESLPNFLIILFTTSSLTRPSSA